MRGDDPADRAAPVRRRPRSTAGGARPSANVGLPVGLLPGRHSVRWWWRCSSTGASAPSPSRRTHGFARHRGVRVEPGSDIAGPPLAGSRAATGGLVSRVLASPARGTPRFDWLPRRDRPACRGATGVMCSPPGAGLSTFPGRKPPAGQHTAIIANLFRQYRLAGMGGFLTIYGNVWTRNKIHRPLCASPQFFVRASLSR